MAAARAAWRAAQGGRHPERLVSLDETWVKSNMTPGSGWRPTHRRVAEAVPHGHGKAIPFVAPRRADGRFAPRVVDGAGNGDLSRACVEPPLAPALRAGDPLVMGNRPSHRGAGVPAAVERAGATLVCRPPYSPHLNPIEQGFAKAKGEIRRRKPRTVADTETWGGDALGRFPPAECRNYLRHGGYGPPGST